MDCYKYTFLSVQSCVSYGHVGNSSVTFPLQRLGVSVLPIHTVLFSNHTGYGNWTGRVLDPDLVKNIFLGLKERDILHKTDALLTGYMGSEELGCVMLDIFEELKKLSPKFIYCCDPVMGDVGRGFFVKNGIPEFFKEKLLPKATILTPNQFELEYLSGDKVFTLDDAQRATRRILQAGVKVVLVTSLMLENQEDKIHVLAADSKNTIMLSTPILPVSLNGAGDLTAALFTYFYLKTSSLHLALEQTIARIYSLIHATGESHSKELLLVQEQENLVKPKFYFKSRVINPV